MGIIINISDIIVHTYSADAHPAVSMTRHHSQDVA
jgi:hypothetical protein